MVENAQSSQRETATCKLVFVKKLDTKLPSSRVMLDLVGLFLFLFGVIDLFDGGEEVVEGTQIIKFLKLIRLRHARAKMVSTRRTKAFTFKLYSHLRNKPTIWILTAQSLEGGALSKHLAQPREVPSNILGNKSPLLILRKF